MFPSPTVPENVADDAAGVIVSWMFFWLFFVGVIIWIAVAVYVLYREILGLIRVLDSRPF